MNTGVYNITIQSEDILRFVDLTITSKETLIKNQTKDDFQLVGYLLIRVKDKRTREEYSLSVIFQNIDNSDVYDVNLSIRDKENKKVYEFNLDGYVISISNKALDMYVVGDTEICEILSDFEEITTEILTEDQDEEE